MGQIAVLYPQKIEKKEKNRGEKFNACRINFLCTIKHIQFCSVVQRSMRSTRKALKKHYPHASGQTLVATENSRE